jgi:hypothetical protein
MPTVQDVHVDQVLTNIGVAYMQSADNFIFNKVAPIIPVSKQSDKYIVWDKGDWFRDEAQKRADNTESAGGGYRFSRDSYFADVWAFHRDVGAQILANADAGMNLESGATKFVTQRLMLRAEKQWATDFFTNVWGTNTTPATTWDDYTASDPVEDIETAKETILSGTGMEANTLVLGYQVWRKLRNHPDIVDRFKTANAGQNISTAQLSAVFEIPRIFVCKAIINTGALTAAGGTTTMGFLHGKHAWVGHVATSPGPDVPSAMYTFAWDYVSGGLGQTIGIDSFYIRKTKTTRYEGEIAFDNKVVATDLGYFFSGAVA